MTKDRAIDLALETIQMSVPLSQTDINVLRDNLGLVYAAGYGVAADKAMACPMSVDQWRGGELVKTWDSAADAAKALDISARNIAKAAAGRYSIRPGFKHHYAGSEWKYF